MSFLSGLPVPGQTAAAGSAGPSQLISSLQPQSDFCFSHGSHGSAFWHSQSGNAFSHLLHFGALVSQGHAGPVTTGIASSIGQAGPVTVGIGCSQGQAAIA